MTTTGASRIASARQVLRTARIAIGAGSLVLFGAAFAAARASHPAQATHASGASTAASRFSDDQDDGSFAFGGGSIGPSTAATPSFGTGSS